MTELAVFQYPDLQAEKLCERAIATIRQAKRSLLHGIITIGEELLIVKEVLGHGELGRWLSANFNWSHATANNYMNAARTVDEYPGAWELDAEVLYLLTQQVPNEVKIEIIDARPISPEEAKEVIEKYNCEMWKDEILELMAHDLGAAYFEIEKAIDKKWLESTAREVLTDNVETFARLAGRDPQELLIEGGVDFDNRYPRNGERPGKPVLTDANGEASFVVWLGNNVQEPLTICTLPKTTNPVQVAWRNAAIHTLVKGLGVKV